MPFVQNFVSVNATQQDLKNFDCGKPKKNEFLSRHAARHMGMGISSTWCLLSLKADGTPHKGKAPVAAYYTFTSHTAKREDINLKKAPPFDLPVVLLAKLAVDQKYQGQGLGSKTLIYALRHAVTLTDRGLPAVGLILDVADKDALNFYSSFEFFQEVSNNPMRLFIPMSALRQL